MPVRLITTVLLLLAIVMLLFSRAQPDLIARSRTAVTDAASPAFNLLSQPANAVSALFDNAEGLLSVHEENARLRAENERLKAWRATALKLEETITQYDALLNVQVEPDIRFATGRTVADTSGPFVNTLIVNIGREQGVREGQAAVDSLGLVGHVVGTGERASRILLLTDLNSRIPVTVQPGNHHAVLVGTNTTRPELEFVRPEDDIRVGDRVVTSGADGNLPWGIPVGTVNNLKDGTWRVALFARQQAAEFVRILFFDFPKKIDRNVTDPGLDLTAGVPLLGVNLPEAAAQGPGTGNGTGNGSGDGTDNSGPGLQAGGQAEMPENASSPAADAPGAAAPEDPDQPPILPRRPNLPLQEDPDQQGAPIASAGDGPAEAVAAQSAAPPAAGPVALTAPAAVEADGAEQDNGASGVTAQAEPDDENGGTGSGGAGDDQ